MLSIREAAALVEPFFAGFPLSKYVMRHDDDIVFCPHSPQMVVGLHPVGVHRRTGELFIRTSSAAEFPDWYWNGTWELMEDAIADEESRS
ncbi:hypothetical protein [Corynebacterium sp. 13CS0277]|uniref:hypothetical protein n=1 Tax=Corynebacterium sp. 13CS0277 TaxID=2071994 RepID=UPI0011B29780|nr:hypothetical protein [Corynebacterium sp. 13CS0277]